jgi:hypothetical protein
VFQGSGEGNDHVGMVMGFITAVFIITKLGNQPMFPSQMNAYTIEFIQP